jgi:phosphoribulokinase
MHLHPTDAVDRLVDLTRDAGRRPLLIGIDGQGGAGKSSFARRLVQRLDSAAVVVEGDDFYRDLPDDERVLLDAEQGVEQYFDWQRLRREVLEPVARAEQVLRYQRYDWPAETMGDWVEMPMPDVVIVEGVYTLRPQLRDLVDVKVYVEASDAVRRRRQFERGENTDEWIDRWVAAEDLYVARTAPRTVADVVVDSE